MNKILKSAICPNGRFGEHHISVEGRMLDDGSAEYFYRNGYADPLLCSYEQAIAFFNDRLKAAAFDLLKDLAEIKTESARENCKREVRRFFASIRE